MSPRSFARRSQSLRRRRPRLIPRPSLLIICEGEKTEPSYFLNLRGEHKNRLVSIRIDDEGGVPKTLVERAAVIKRQARREAARRRDDTLTLDEVWCVFDVDQHPNIEDAKQQAHDNGVSLAISNPSFELWLVLHFQKQNSYVTRQNIRASCQEHLAGYNKELSAEMYDLLAQNYGDAVERSAALEAMHERNGSPRGENPSTGVFRLTERIASFGKTEHIASVSRET
jgi:hypothetical protein